MKISLVIPPISFLNYPINEAGLFCKYLEKAGHSVEIVELHLDFLDFFLEREANNIKKALGIYSDEDPVYVKTLSDIFETDDNASYIYEQISNDSRFFEFAKQEIIGQGADYVIYILQYMRTVPRILPWIFKLSNEIRKSQNFIKQAIAGHGLRELPNWAFDQIIEQSSIEKVFLGEEYDISSLFDDQRKIQKFNFSNLENLELPDLSKYNLDRYLNNKIGTRAINIYYTRGCVGNCIFCHEKEVFPGYRSRPPEEVVKEMDYLSKEYGIALFRFSDSILNPTKDHILSLAEELLKDKRRNHLWAGMIRANHSFSESEAQMLFESGCRALWCGVESGDETVIKFVEKDVKLNILNNLAKVLSQNGIDFVTFWILGAPWDDQNSAIKSSERITEIIKHGGGVHFFPFRLYCNAKMCNDSNRMGLKVREEFPLDNQYDFYGLTYDSTETIRKAKLDASHLAKHHFLYKIDDYYLVSEL